MKKYIVADDGKIYDKFGIDLELEKTGVLNCYYIVDNYGCRIYYTKEDFDKLKQSDTIEELCDAFVAVDTKMKLLPAEDILKLNKKELEEYINKLNNEFIDLDFKNKELINTNNSLERRLSDIKQYVANK